VKPVLSEIEGSKGVFVIRGFFRLCTPRLPKKQVNNFHHESTLRLRSGQAKFGKTDRKNFDRIYRIIRMVSQFPEEIEK
jgi:hypothetical protein